MAASDRGIDWVQEPMAVAEWDMPEYLKRAKLSQDDAAKELDLDPGQLRNYLYRHTIPLAIFKRITLKRGLLGTKKPDVIQMKAPFRLPKAYRAWVGDAALDFDKLAKAAPTTTNGDGKSTPLTRATPEQRREWMARAAETRRKRRAEREAQAELTPVPAVVPDTEPTLELSAPSLSTSPPAPVPPQLSEMWTQVYVSTLGYMTQQVSQQAVELERLRQQVAEQRAAKQRVERERDEWQAQCTKLRQDLETAEQLLGERVAVVAEAPPEVITAVQAAVAKGVDGHTNGDGGIFQGLTKRVDPVAQVEGELPK